MKLRVDLTGEKIGRLQIIKRIESDNKRYVMWECFCDCGKMTNVRTCDLRSGNTKSCGCYRSYVSGSIRKTHGKSSRDNKRVAEYDAWICMKSRCNNKNISNYSDYGGRGIKICERWEDSFDNFLSDMGEKPSPLHSVERRKNNLGYSPDNCYWATIEEQSRNKRNNRWYDHGGKRMILTDWAKYFKINPATLSEHLSKKTFKQVFLFYSNKPKKW